MEVNVENRDPESDGTVDSKRLWWSLRKRLLQRVKKVEMSQQIRELLANGVQVQYVGKNRLSHKCKSMEAI